MKLSTRARYGTRALLDLALQGENRPVPLKDIAHRQQISLTYLEHLVTPLISAGIVRSTRGLRGGITLAKLPSEITMAEIVNLLEGSTAPVDCLSNLHSCNRIDFCAARDFWLEVQQAMNQVLETTTLENLVAKQKRKGQAGEMYYI